MNTERQEAERLAAELSRIRSEYVLVPHSVWAGLKLIPALLRRARTVHPGLVSVETMMQLQDMEDHWSEICGEK